MPNNGKKKKNNNHNDKKRKEAEQAEEMRKKIEKEETNQRILEKIRDRERVREEEDALVATSSRACEMKAEGGGGKKKKGPHDDDDKDKRRDDKRRDSLGGSVSTSSNSSTTDCDETLSDHAEGLKRALTSPTNDSSSVPSSSPDSQRLSIASPDSSPIFVPEALSNFTANLTAACTNEALSDICLQAPYVTNEMTKVEQKAQEEKSKKNKTAELCFTPPSINNQGIINNHSGPNTPTTPRVIPTNRSAAVPSPEVASFRSIADEYPTVLPNANPPTSVEVVRPRAVIATAPSTSSHLAQTKAEKNRKKRLRKLEKKHGGGGSGGVDGTESIDTPRFTNEDEFDVLERGGRRGEYNVQQIEASPRHEYHSYTDYLRSSIFRDLAEQIMHPPQPITGLQGALHATGIAGSGYFEEDIGTDDANILSHMKSSGREPYSQKFDTTFDWLNELQQKQKAEKEHPEAWLVHERKVLSMLHSTIEEVYKTISNPWIRKLITCVYEGKSKKVLRRIRVIVNLLRHQPANRHIKYKHMLEHVGGVIHNLGIHTTHKYSFVHTLASQSSTSKQCGMDGKHAQCQTLDLMLGLLNGSSLQKAISMPTESLNSRLPVHFATATGQPCQLDVILGHNADATLPDGVGQTPVHYAYIRDHLMMTRMLMWHGADLNQCDERTGCTPDEMKYPDGSSIAPSVIPYVRPRMAALEKTLQLWISRLSNDRFFLRTNNPLSALHVIRPMLDSDRYCVSVELPSGSLNVNYWTGHVQKTVHLRLRELKTEDRSQLFLLIVPFSYTHKEVDTNASHPHVIRHCLVREYEAEGAGGGQFMRTLPHIRVGYNGRTANKSLIPMFENDHTGMYYAYKMPGDLAGARDGKEVAESVAVTFSMNMNVVDPRVAPHLRLMMQVYSVSPVPIR